jgi:hypothetical protein
MDILREHDWDFHIRMAKDRRQVTHIHEQP